MAVIKIVPMPGAVGDKGDEGAVGPQGQQGPAGQNGLPGTPALWSYQGAYNSAAAYAVGDIVIYQGQLYYTKSVTTAGTLPTVTAKFDLIASKGADGTNGTNGADGSDGAPGTNGADALWNYVGEYGGGTAYAVGDVVTFDGQLWYRYNANGGNVGDTPSPGLWNLLAAKGADNVAPTSGTWDTRFSELSGISGGLYGGTRTTTSEEMNKGRYYTVGDLVFFEFNFLVTQPLSFTLNRRFQGALPFPVAGPWQLNQPSNFITNTATGIYQPFGDDIPVGVFDPDEAGRIPLIAVLYNSYFSLLASTYSSGILETDGITSSWPVNLNVPNTETVSFAGTPNETTLYSPTVRIYFSGVYRKA